MADFENYYEDEGEYEDENEYEDDGYISNHYDYIDAGNRLIEVNGDDHNYGGKYVTIVGSDDSDNIYNILGYSVWEVGFDCANYFDIQINYYIEHPFYASITAGDGNDYIVN